MRAVTAYSAGL